MDSVKSRYNLQNENGNSGTWRETIDIIPKLSRKKKDEKVDEIFEMMKKKEKTMSNHGREWRNYRIGKKKCGRV